ncbi:MAG: hypothetical protein M5U28_23355 [Sandaracinaceae bacterium]|nr:hypothetical protein [Sandaracinaceae bacterium]
MDRLPPRALADDDAAAVCNAPGASWKLHLPDAHRSTACVPAGTSKRRHAGADAFDVLDRKHGDDCGCATIVQ